MALTDKLSAIGTAIREKSGTTKLLTLDEMPTAIGAIETGGGGGDIPEEAFVISGNCDYRFYKGGWEWFLENHSNKIITKDITGAFNMFYGNSNLEEIPFDLNFKKDTQCDIKSMFDSCNKLKRIGSLGTASFKPTKITNFFKECHNLRELPENFGDNIDWSYLESQTGAYIGEQSSIFSNCYSLRKLPMNLIKSGNPNLTNTYSIYPSLANGCCALDEIVNLPIPYTKATWTSNAMGGLVTNCYRLKNLTFATNEDGSPIVVKWKSQTLDLSSGVGYASYNTTILKYNSGITADKEVIDDESYQRLKNDPDWFTTKPEYSRYNKASAIATINSLPDTSAYLLATGSAGTNTIKFKTNANKTGKFTDGGAINELSAEEIAVAAARGWTVTML